MENKQKKVILVVALIIGVLALVLGLTYAFFQLSRGGDSNIIQLADGLNLILEDEETINISETMPMTDDYAMDNLDTYNFKLQNTGSKVINYQIIMEHITEDLPKGKLRYVISADDGTSYSEPNGLADFSYEKIISGNATTSFK